MIEKLKPYETAFENLTNPNFKDVIVLKKIKKGMALSIGNALRRTILQYTLGYGIISLSIANVSNEFTNLFGLKEDMQQLIANLSKIVFSGDVAFSTATLKVSKEQVVTARSISTNLKIVNLDEYICTLTENIELHIDMKIKKHYGSVLMNQFESDEINSIIPSVVCFSPIVNVNYNVIENLNNFEDLEIEITTNGGVTPQQAFDYAYVLFLDQLQVFNVYETHKSAQAAVEPKEDENAKIYLNILNKRVTEFVEKDKILNCLKSMGVEYVGELVQLSEGDLLKQPKFGQKSIDVLKNQLHILGLSLHMHVDWKRPDSSSAIIED